MAKKKTIASGKEISFEEALARLEAIVKDLEESDLPLEKSLAVFEEGVRLSRLLHEKLNEAEKKVEILLKNEEGEKIAVPFTGDTETAIIDEDEDEDTDEDEDEGPGQTGFRF